MGLGPGPLRGLLKVLPALLRANGLPAAAPAPAAAPGLLLLLLILLLLLLLLGVRSGDVAGETCDAFLREGAPGGRELE